MAKLTSMGKELRGATGSPTHNYQRCIVSWMGQFKAHFSCNPALSTPKTSPVHQASAAEVHREVLALEHYKALGFIGLTPALFKERRREPVRAFQVLFTRIRILSKPLLPGENQSLSPSLERLRAVIALTMGVPVQSNAIRRLHNMLEEQTREACAGSFAPVMDLSGQPVIIGELSGHSYFMLMDIHAAIEPVGRSVLWQCFLRNGILLCF